MVPSLLFGCLPVHWTYVVWQPYNFPSFIIQKLLSGETCHGNVLENFKVKSYLNILEAFDPNFSVIIFSMHTQVNCSTAYFIWTTYCPPPMSPYFAKNFNWSSTEIQILSINKPNIEYNFHSLMIDTYWSKYFINSKLFESFSTSCRISTNGIGFELGSHGFVLKYIWCKICFMISAAFGLILRSTAERISSSRNSWWNLSVFTIQ